MPLIVPTTCVNINPVIVDSWNSENIYKIIQVLKFLSNN